MLETLERVDDYPEWLAVGRGEARVAKWVDCRIAVRRDARKGVKAPRPMHAAAAVDVAELQAHAGHTDEAASPAVGTTTERLAPLASPDHHSNLQRNLVVADIDMHVSSNQLAPTSLPGKLILTTTRLSDPLHKISRKQVK
jgi:hypothetical protein